MPSEGNVTPEYERVEALRLILEREQCRPVSYAEAAEIGVADVVGDDEHDVWFRRSRGLRRGGRGRQARDEERQGDRAHTGSQRDLTQSRHDRHGEHQ